ncbi:ankyrin repeat domain-containing protein [Holosporaceae bacterium 'Namur']|nr:ankyrin repeat domain-containing protein [Holosporaceae bacterium 'Namur']
MNYYDILKVEHNATEEVIRKSYYKAARKSHPDKNPEDREAAEENFKKIAAAYEVLSNRELRLEYDTYLLQERSRSKQKAYQTNAEKAGNYSPSENQWQDPDMDRERAEQLLRDITKVMESYIEEQKRRHELGKQLANAAKEGNWQQVNSLFKEGAFLDELSDESRAVLHYVVEKGDLKRMQALIENGANIDVQDGYGNTPLHYAASKGDIKTCRYLVSNGANLYLQNYRNKNTPLHSALKNEHIDVALFLAKYPTEGGIIWKTKSHDLQDKEGNTPLHITLENQYYDLANELLRQGAKVDIQNNKGFKQSSYLGIVGSHTTKILLERRINDVAKESSSCITM